jgi:hypothetical protein
VHELANVLGRRSTVRVLECADDYFTGRNEQEGERIGKEREQA